MWVAPGGRCSQHGVLHDQSSWTELSYTACWRHWACSATESWDTDIQKLWNTDYPFPSIDNGSILLVLLRILWHHYRSSQQKGMLWLYNCSCHQGSPINDVATGSVQHLYLLVPHTPVQAQGLLGCQGGGGCHGVTPLGQDVLLPVGSLQLLWPDPAHELVGDVTDIPRRVALAACNRSQLWATCPPQAARYGQQPVCSYK